MNRCSGPPAQLAGLAFDLKDLSLNLLPKITGQVMLVTGKAKIP
jgi:hypothetical protein